MKKYESPSFEVEYFTIADVVATTSRNPGTGIDDWPEDVDGPAPISDEF